MTRLLAVLAVVVVGGLWVTAGQRHQPSVGPEERTVQAQMTVVASPTKAT